MDKIILFIYIMELVITEKDEQMPDLFNTIPGLVLGKIHFLQYFIIF